MSDLEDFEFSRSGAPEEEPGGPGRRFPARLIAGAVVMVAAVAGLGYLAFRRPATPRTTPTTAPGPAQPPSVAPSPTPAAIKLPPLDASDALVRELAEGLSADPQYALWLATKSLIRTLTVVVENVAEGGSPRAHLGFLTPRKGFSVVQRRGRLLIDPRSYERYDGFADTMASLDAAGCARVYRQLEPLFELAYRELGHPEGGFSKALGRAMGTLLEVPVLEGDVPVRRVVRAVVLYEYLDRRLEDLPPARKHLLRMGPRNVRKLQAKLRELAEALPLKR